MSELKHISDGPEGKDTSAGSLLNALKRSSLRAAGIGYFLADTALITSGFLAGEGKVASAGMFGLTAGAVGARYGNPKAEKQLEQMERRLGAYLRKQGVEIPKGPTAEALAKEGGVIDHIESFLYSYPSQVMNAFYSLIGLQLARSALSHPKPGIHKEKAFLLASGSLLITGALAGLLLPEKKPDPEHPPKGMLERFMAKPLRVSGTLFNANQVFLGLNALEQRRNNPGNKSYLFKLLAVAGFTFGNTMMAISSKSHGGGNAMDEKALSALAETSAHVIAAQPPEVQNALLERVSGFLASQSNVRMTAGQISELLHKALKEVSSDHPQAGWAGRMSNNNDAGFIPTHG